MPLPVEVLECLIRTEQLDLDDLLELCVTCKVLHSRLAGALPAYLEYTLPNTFERRVQHAVRQPSMPISHTCAVANPG